MTRPSLFMVCTVLGTPFTSAGLSVTCLDAGWKRPGLKFIPTLMFILSVPARDCALSEKRAHYSHAI